MQVENNMTEDWVESFLEENISEIAMGPFGSNLKREMFTKEGVPIIKGTNLSSMYVDGEFTFVSEEKATNLRKAVAYPNDIIITHRGTIGQVSLVPQNKYDRYVTSQSQLRFSCDPKKLYYKYILYFLKSRIGQYELLKSSSQVGVPAIATPTKSIKEIKLYLPPLPEQKAIAKVLTAFDDKIELLQAQNKTLETMAQTIFKEWFGKYQIGDELPEGWRVGRLKDLGNIICGKTPSKADNENFGGNIPFIKIPDMHNKMFIITTTDSLTKKGVSLQKNKLIPKNSICVSCIATVGLVSITSKDSQTNQQINSIIPFNDSYKEFIYFKVKGLNKYLHDIGSGGTATLNVNTTSFSNIEIVIPDAKKLYSFSKITNPIFKKVLDNDKQIQSLTKTRDTLLPKLMSGQVRVKNIKHTADA